MIWLKRVYGVNSILGIGLKLPKGERYSGTTLRVHLENSQILKVRNTAYEIVAAFWQAALHILAVGSNDMKQVITLLSLFFLSLTCISQTNTGNDTTTQKEFKSLSEIIALSETIDNETFDLKFLIRVLPDNGWYLKLNKDSSYEYIHWSGWGDSDGTILEKGRYEVSKNKIKLHPDKKIRSALAKTQFYLVTSESNEMDNHITYNCAEAESKMYCLYQK